MRHRKPRRIAMITDAKLARIAAAFASVGAALVHFATAPDHLREWWPSGAFFFGIAALQTAWAAGVIRWGSHRLLHLGVVTNAGSILLWAVSRSVGIPFGPQAGVPEPATRADVFTVVMESMVCLGALWCVWRRSTRTLRPPSLALGAVGAAGILVSALTVPALGSATTGHAHSAGHGHSDHGHSPGEAERIAPERRAPEQNEPRPAGTKTATRTSAPQRQPHHDGHSHEH
ncbi:MAG: hypothetical protein GEV03_24070 [Streptosporangiales bacterium]|nr:hypothetical protein [Streptosporangiales bacterium]